jgi:nicotinamidase-related amidase
MRPSAHDPDSGGRTIRPMGASSSGDALLIVVDMQRVFGDPESPWATPGFDGLIEPIDRLVRAYSDRVVFTRFVAPSEPEGAWADYYDMWEFVRRPEAVPLLDLVEPWTNAAPTLDTTTFSKFGPELVTLAGQSRALIVCGVTTDCCVLSTVLDAVDAGMHVRVVKDACAGVDGAAHERAIAIMAGFRPHVEVTTVARELETRDVRATD